MNSPKMAALIQPLEQRRLLAAYESAPFPFEMIDLTPVDSMVAVDGTDDGFTGITLPAGKIFRFWDIDYTQLFVSANGLITFGSGSSNPNNGDLTISPAQAAIAPLWDDWDTSSGLGSAVLYRFENSDTRLVIEWNNVPHLDVGGDNGVTFQAILSLSDMGATVNNTMFFNYVDLVVGDEDYDNGASATEGMKDAGTQTGMDGRRLLIAQDTAHDWVGDSKAIRIRPDSAPEVLDIDFRFETAPQRIEVSFSKDVSASLDITDLDITPLPAGTTFNPTGLEWVVATNTAKFTFTGKLPDSNYQAVLPASDVQDPLGNPLASSAQLDFFFLDADANHDRRVNLQDFNRIAANFGQSNRDFTQGDFNYDTIVNLQDFNLLAGRFGTELAASPSIGGMLGALDRHRVIADSEDADATSVRSVLT